MLPIIKFDLIAISYYYITVTNCNGSVIVIVKLDHSCNAVFMLTYHLILVVKYRQKVFTNNDIINDLKEKINDISNNFSVEVIEQETDIDHIHILFKSKPTLEITKYINSIKGVSSRLLRQKYKDFLRNKLWGKAFWSPSYYLATTGNVALSTLIKYVEDQGKEEYNKRERKNKGVTK
jgi:putative transposase